MFDKEKFDELVNTYADRKADSDRESTWKWNENTGWELIRFDPEGSEMEQAYEELFSYVSGHIRDEVLNRFSDEDQD